MTDAATLATPATPDKRGPKTAEGKARSSRNALKHGLRARTFGILPGEDQAEWGQHLQELRQGYGPVDAAEEKLVAAIAAGMWHEVRADRTLAEVLAAIPPLDEGRPHGGDLQEPRHALSLNTALRYLSAAGMATQRAQRAFLAHRKAKRDGLILPEAEPSERAANQNGTNENTVEPDRPRGPPPPAEPEPQNGTNEFDAPRPSGPRAPLRARLDQLLGGPGPRAPEDWDLAAAIRALELPGGPPYRGAVDPGELGPLLAERPRFDAAGLARLAGPRPVAGANAAAVTFPGRR